MIRKLFKFTIALTNLNNYTSVFLQSVPFRDKKNKTFYNYCYLEWIILGLKFYRTRCYYI